MLSIPCVPAVKDLCDPKPEDKGDGNGAIVATEETEDGAHVFLLLQTRKVGRDRVGLQQQDRICTVTRYLPIGVTKLEISLL